MPMQDDKERYANYTWADIKEIERRRLKILSKVEYPFWRVLSSWHGTCLQAMATDSMVWVPLLIFAAVRWLAHSDITVPGSVTEAMEFSNIGILGGFLSFLLVLFVNQTNARFFEMYKLSRACSGRVQDIAGFSSARLPPAAAARLVRYMNAAHLAGYVGLGGPYSKRNFFDHFNDLHELLTPQELAKFEEYGYDMDKGSDIFKELCTWCQKEIARVQAERLIDGYEATEMTKKVLDLRAHMDGIYDTRDQPPHFFYIHFLCILTGLYLPLFALQTATGVGWEEFHWTMEGLAGIVVLVQSIFVVGLRLLGQKMIDPYGDDLEDLMVITIVTTCIEITRICLSSHDQGQVDPNMELETRHRHNQFALNGRKKPLPKKMVSSMEGSERPTEPPTERSLARMDGFDPQNMSHHFEA